MGTHYETIYARFLTYISDYEFLLYNDASQQQILLELLKLAITDFEICTQDLTQRDDKVAKFTIDLTPKEIEILAIAMACHWLQPKVMNADNLRNVLNTKDYTAFSPARLLEQMIILLDKMEKKFTREMNMYSYRNGDIASLGDA